MKALFVAPLPFVGTTATGIAAPIAGSVDNLNSDIPGRVWRGVVTGSVVVDLGASPVVYDTIAIVGSNLRATDTIRVQTGSAPGTMNGFDSGTVAAWSGTKPSRLTANSIVKLAAKRTERYLRVTFTATAHPAGYIQFQRLVIGDAVTTLGVKIGAKMNFEDRSVITSGPGATIIDRYDVLPAWEVTTTGITDADWRQRWAPLLLEVGSSSGLLFVRDADDPTTFQTDSVYGRITSKAYGEVANVNWWTFSGTILAFAP